MQEGEELRRPRPHGSLQARSERLPGGVKLHVGNTSLQRWKTVERERK